MVSPIVRERSDCLQTLDRNLLFASATIFKCLPVEEVEDFSLLLNDLEEAFTDDLNLINGFFRTSLKHLFDKFIDIGLGDFDVFAVGAQRYLITTGEHCSKILVDTVLEIFITQIARMLLHITQDLRRVSINSIQVMHRDLFLQELFPDPGGQVKWQWGLAQERES